MARIIKIFILSAALIGAFTTFRSQPTNARINMKPLAPGPAEIYAAHCATCHGGNGRARTAKGKRVGATDFTSSDWNTDEARGIRIITNGKGEMPGFKGKLSPKDIKAVFGHVLRFRQ